MELFIEGRRRVRFLFDPLHFKGHFTETSPICGSVKREGAFEDRYFFTHLYTNNTDKCIYFHTLATEH